MKKTPLPIDFTKSRKSAGILRALAHPLRLQILAFISEHGKTYVGKIHESFKMDQSICSQHLKVLRDADLVEVKRNYRRKEYTINYDRIEHINTICSSLKATA